MKLTLKSILIVIILLFTLSKSLKCQNINEQEKIGFSYFNTNADSSIYYYQQAITQYNLIDDFKSQARCLQNISFIYDEQILDNYKSFFYANASLDFWLLAKDSLNAANIKKQIALLYAKNGQFTLAKKYIDDAILMFKHLKFEDGVYVTLFDWALILEMENKLKESLTLLIKIKSYWKTQGNNIRLFLTNNQIIKKYDKQYTLITIDELINENKNLIEQKIIPLPLIEKFNDLIKK
ncbi:MAG: hypothetical protein K0B10_15460 [Vicingaceae bacterium]|nr:hypothetical protein [Vicingaceae bacterium]